MPLVRVRDIHVCGVFISHLIYAIGCRCRAGGFDTNIGMDMTRCVEYIDRSDGGLITAKIVLSTPATL